jgi:L-alanine-DL-glutamate epimerase-like enolase superfamily enzyme
MVETILSALSPVVVTLLLGFVAAWRQDFGTKDATVLNRMVLLYAVPSALFVGTREVIGADDDLMIDVNRGWSLQTAIEGARLLEPLNIRWLEEPVRWLDDHRELRLLARQTKIPRSAGESGLFIFRCRDLIEDHAIQVLQADSTMSGGYTALRKLAALCELNRVHLAPHHDCFLHAPLVASSPAALILESFDADRDPLQAELFENPPKMENGILTLNDAPGVGVTLSAAALQKYRRKII